MTNASQAFTPMDTPLEMLNDTETPTFTTMASRSTASNDDETMQSSASTLQADDELTETYSTEAETLEYTTSSVQTMTSEEQSNTSEHPQTTIPMSESTARLSSMAESTSEYTSVDSSQSSPFEDERDLSSISASIDEFSTQHSSAPSTVITVVIPSTHLTSFVHHSSPPTHLFSSSTLFSETTYETTTTISTPATTELTSISSHESSPPSSPSQTTEPEQYPTTTSSFVSTSTLTTESLTSSTASTTFVGPTTIADIQPTTLSSTQDMSTVSESTFESSSMPVQTSSTEEQLLTTTVQEHSTFFLTTEESTSLPLTSTVQEDTVASFESTPYQAAESTSWPTILLSSISTYEATSSAPASTYESSAVVTSLSPTDSSPPPKSVTRKRTTRRTTSTTTTTTEQRVLDTRRAKLNRSRTSTRRTTTTTTTTIPPVSTQTYQSTLLPPPAIKSNRPSAPMPEDLSHTLFQSNASSPSHRHVHIDLIDRPPTSWNLSFQTNDSILLDIVLPVATDLSTVPNLTLSNIHADRFAATIVGSSVNLQVDDIQTKDFSLAVNLTNNGSAEQPSEVIIGHVKSDQFHLTLTKSNKMNVQVAQVDSATAELYFDEGFCSNDSNVQINLNLSQNGRRASSTLTPPHMVSFSGTIRYGNRPPIRIGPVFTRVYMLKGSCGRDQPLVMFFDICQGQNPCMNNGTCESVLPNFDDDSVANEPPPEMNYRCLCPPHVSGDYCQNVEYPFGYCTNGGSLLHRLDARNQTEGYCVCPPGFQGDHCEDNINDCSNIDCSNHGICQDGIETYTCACFDGFFGKHCEDANMETVLLQVASKSFALVAILLISSIGILVVASDIHTYVTRHERRSQHYRQVPRVTSELMESSVLLLAFGEAPIELSDLSGGGRRRKASSTTDRKQVGYRPISQGAGHRSTKSSLSNRHSRFNPS